MIDVSDKEPQRPIAAGRELLLECVTSDLGLPRANGWLWFKNGQPIESLPSSSQQIFHTNTTSNNLILTQDNLITESKDSSAAFRVGSSPTLSLVLSQRGDGPDNGQLENRTSQFGAPNYKLIDSGKYLHFPSVQLFHRGNYSCVAVNRLGPGLKLSSRSLEQDFYHLHVALAPSFVQPLASRTNWPEVSLNGDGMDPSQQLELVCHVQCEPLCQIEWLRNNEVLDVRRQSEGLSSNYINYQIKQTIRDENPAANMFKSVESKLVLQFKSDNANSIHQHPQFNREKILERRMLLSGANYTCQSSPNSMGPPVRSTTKFMVQCEYINNLWIIIC